MINDKKIRIAKILGIIVYDPTKFKDVNVFPMQILFNSLIKSKKQDLYGVVKSLTDII